MKVAAKMSFIELVSEPLSWYNKYNTLLMNSFPREGNMQFKQSLEKKWYSCENYFDMAALCYDLIVSYIGDMPEAVFISQYMDIGKTSETSNPNLKGLLKLENDVKTILYEEPFPPTQADSIWNLINHFADKALPFGDDKTNQAAVFMSILMGIDLYIEFLFEMKFQFSSNGPLNHTDRAGSLVYLKNKHSLLDTIKTTYSFRSSVSSGGIRDALSTLLLMKKADFFPTCNYPKIKPFSIHEGRTKIRTQLIEDKILKIAIIPNQKPNSFEFDEDSTPGSTFRVKYTNDQKTSIEKHCKWIETAIRHGANIIILPEFFTSQEILEGIKLWFKEKRPEVWMQESSLIAVFTGTTWHESDNNIMHLLDEQGNELGTYYKYSPFTQLPPNTEDSNTYKMCERLTTPGKESLLLDIEFVGRALPSICRDVIDGNFTEYLVKSFEPFLLLTSAYSASVQSFNRHYKSYASHYYVTSVLCNACAAVKGSQLSLCTVPMMQATEMTGYTKPIEKCRRKDTECLDSCIILLELDYSGHSERKIGKSPHISYHRCRNHVISVAKKSKK
ncbi:hypothetical protein [Lacrimispora sp. 210928-DFI.3.58]|uniref:hypothetical protein n=1 Tax=Lacrimispora sp. 210928-DFI.3.58 TaxID=2883214 RepID=UPI0015B738B7|nr:hypothetical protein [Lacrimispora sp. 210928-DFI.3.58]MCB7319191.1 hypothetical protein [Lacrimispora sp. 210928-DFI.3.58]